MRFSPGTPAGGNASDQTFIATHHLHLQEHSNRQLKPKGEWKRAGMTFGEHHARFLAARRLRPETLAGRG
jgi:hypothetical protein